MTGEAPRFVLCAEATDRNDGGHWRFRLTTPEGREELAAGDCEPDIVGERLELLSVVRGLEALEQPAQVTVVTSSRYVRAGLAWGLDEWRANNWCWERFGELTPIKHADLWRRVDRALLYHQVECRTWRLDPPHAAQTTLAAEAPQGAQPASTAVPAPASIRRRLARPVEAEPAFAGAAFAAV